MQDVQRILATEWKTMPDDLKQIYHDQHKALRVTFNNDKKIYDQRKEKEAEARYLHKDLNCAIFSLFIHSFVL